MSRIYVACLASYNAGKLHGKWIDADQDADAIRDEIAAMLRASPCPNVMVDCPECGGRGNRDIIGGVEACPYCKETGEVTSSEEYAIHDYELGGIKIGEYESIDTVADLATAIEKHGEAFAAWWNNENRDDVDVEAFEEAYQGCYDSEADSAESFVEDCYGDVLKGLPAFITGNIDWDGIADDFRMGGDVWYHRGSEGVHVFNNR